MTARTPGFPTELETAIAEVLRLHVGAWQHDGDYCHVSWVMCLADKCEATAEDLEEFAAHQAAVVMEVIAQHTTTEWGVRTGVGAVIIRDSRGDAVDYARRLSGRSFRPFQPVSRLVLPWQEVKA